MNLDKTSIIGIAVCVLLYIGYEQFLNTKYPNRYKTKVTQQKENEASKEQTTEPSPRKSTEVAHNSVITDSPQQNNTKPQVKMLNIRELTIENKTVSYVLDQYTGGFKKIELQNYLNEERTKAVSLVDEALGFIGTSYNTFNYPQAPYKTTLVDSNTVKFERQENNWLIEHTIHIDPKSSYGASIDFKWTNLDKKPRELISSVYIFDKIKYANSKKSSGFLPGMPTNRQTISSNIDNSSQWDEVKEFCTREDNEALIDKKNSFIAFSGFDSHYFLKAFIPQAKQSDLVVDKIAQSSNRSCSLYMKHSLEQGQINPGESANFKLKAWFGPKSQEVMTSFSPALKEALDLGMFSQISHVFLYILQFLYSIMGNWGIAIIIFTLLLKTLLYPLVKSSSTSMYKMKAFQPALNSIKEKHKDNPQKQQQETLKFMSQHKINPLKGCLPILPQFPLFIACWRTLSSSVELRHAPFFGWIQDLSAADPYYVTPILLGLCMFLQQKLTPTTGMDKTQEKMLMFMPLMFSIFMLTLPSGMVLYSLTNSVISIAQQQWLNKKLAASSN